MSKAEFVQVMPAIGVAVGLWGGHFGAVIWYKWKGYK